MTRHLQAQSRQQLSQPVVIDQWLLIPILILMGIGVVMVGSASVAIGEKHGFDSTHYLFRHLLYLALGGALAASLIFIKLRYLQILARPILLLALLLLCSVFIPGLGHTVNGSTRWIDLGIVNFQVVEAVKIMLIIYVADYLSRRAELVGVRFFDTIKPLVLVGVFSVILLLQPDLGSAVVLTAIVGGMVWLAGAAWRHVVVLGLLILPAFGFAAMEPYRLRRIVSFLKPWEDPFNSGFQLTQALIAVGRGEVFGVGLGASVQKLHFLPEAHTDFIFAVLAEELGLVGVVLMLAMFMLLISRILVVGSMAHKAGRPFHGYIAYGIGLWLGLQTLVSIGVNLGVLPTKGLTLPLISSGGSSILMTCFALGLVLRIKYELDREHGRLRRKRRQGSGT